MNPLTAKFCSEDVVYRDDKLHKCSKLGVVVQSCEDYESDDEDDSYPHRRVQLGECQVAWYPSGRNETLRESDLQLLNRTLLPGDIVARAFDDGKISERGTVLDTHLSMVIKIYNTNKVIENVTPEELSKAAKINQDSLVLYKNYLGRITTVEYRYKLLFNDGREWTVNEEDIACMKFVPNDRRVRSHFDDNVLVIGQHIELDVKSMPCKLVKLYREAGGTGDKVECFIIDVIPDLIHVDWILRLGIPNVSIPPGSLHHVSGELDSQTMADVPHVELQELIQDISQESPPVLSPPRRLPASEFANMKEINLHDNATYQLGDRAYYVIKSSDKQKSYDEWKLEFHHSLTREEDEQTPSMNEDEAGAIAALPDVHGDDQKTNTRGNESGNEKMSTSSGSSRTRAQPRKRKRHSKIHYAKCMKHSKRVDHKISYEPGCLVGCEIVAIQSTVDVCWQSGVKELEIESSELLSINYTNEHEYFPGDYVQDPKCLREYAVVKSQDSSERIVKLGVFEVQPDGIPKFVREDESSVYDIQPYGMNDFRLGTVVLRLGNTSDLPVARLAGQVKEMPTTGQIVVRWADGYIESMFPCNLVVFGDYEEGEFVSYEDDAIALVGQHVDIENEDWEDVQEDNNHRPMNLEERLRDMHRAVQALNNATPDPTALIKILCGAKLGRVEEGGGDEDDGSSEEEMSAIMESVVKVPLPETQKETHREMFKQIGKVVGFQQKGESSSSSSEQQQQETKATQTTVEDSNAEKATSSRSATSTPTKEAVKFMLGKMMSYVFPSKSNGDGDGKTVSKGDDQASSSSVTAAIPETKPAATSPAEPATTASKQKDNEQKEDISSLIQTKNLASPIFDEFINSAEPNFMFMEKVHVSHQYFSSSAASTPKFVKNLRREHQLLQSSLPPEIFVRCYEDRMDLLSAFIIGPKNTPYEGGLFFFDIKLKDDYPATPPKVHYISHCRDRLNPNLYEEGKVCLSLLGTWSGKESESWQVGSNLLQVLVSIQGLILNEEPYYNEAGYEKQRNTSAAYENSRIYNEMAIVKMIQSMTKIIEHPPMPFFANVAKFVREQSRSFVAHYRRLIEWSEAKLSPDEIKAKGLDAGDNVPTFPLLPASKGFCCSLKKALDNYDATIARLKLLSD